MIENIVYFNSPGKVNTMEALHIAKEYARKNNSNKIIVASTTGATALTAAELFVGMGIQITVVGLDTYGWSQDKSRQIKLEEQGLITVPCTRYLQEEVANTLRCFSQGVKVAFEVAIMAAHKNLILDNEETLVIAGSGFGADTVLVLRSVFKNDIKDFTVSKLLCLPINH